MKTKEEVLVHLKNQVYDFDSINKIMGFLIGKGVKSVDEKLVVRIGEVANCDFDDFFEWWESEEVATERDSDVCECPNCILCGIMNDIAKKMEGALTTSEKSYFGDQLAFLIDAFDLDKEETSSETNFS